MPLKRGHARVRARDRARPRTQRRRGVQFSEDLVERRLERTLGQCEFAGNWVVADEHLVALETVLGRMRTAWLRPLRKTRAFSIWGMGCLRCHL